MLQEYLVELSRVKTLSPEDERSLWESFKTRQDFWARQSLIEAYQPLVYRIASKLNRNEQIFFDLIQEGTVGLIEAVEGYQPEQEVLFSTYASHRIRGRMLNYLTRNRTTAKEVSLVFDEDELLTVVERLQDKQTNVENEVADQVLNYRVDHAINRLSSREQQVIRDLFIYDKSPVQTAEEMKISLSYLYKIQKKALQRLRGMLSRYKINIKYDT